MTSPYQSPTRRVAVEVLLDGGRRLAGDVYLHPNALAPGGYESVRAMIEGGEAFFPVAEDGGSVALVGKRHAIALSYAPEGAEAAAGQDPDGDIPLDLHLSDGTTLSGRASAELPRAQPRALDLLNGAGAFLVIRDEGRIHLVNRAHIRVAYPLD